MNIFELLENVGNRGQFCHRLPFRAYPIVFLNFTKIVISIDYSRTNSSNIAPKHEYMVIRLIVTKFSALAHLHLFPRSAAIKGIQIRLLEDDVL
jgi:hypothetical protein